MSSEFVKELTSSDFDAAIAKGVTVIDFWAPWCGPCRMMAPIFEAVAKQMAGQATFAKVNIDDHPDIPARYGVRSIPTLIVIKDGQDAEAHVGAMRPDALLDMIKRHL